MPHPSPAAETAGLDLHRAESLQSTDQSSTGRSQDRKMDLTSAGLPQPRLTPLLPDRNVVIVPAYTDLKLHDITDPAEPAEAEALDMNWFVWSPKFSDGNRRFLTKRLWGCANEPPFFHHGLFTTLRQSILAHNGEAIAERRAFQSLTAYEQDSLIEFLKTLQVLPPGTPNLVVDENFNPREWPPFTIGTKTTRLN